MELPQSEEALAYLAYRFDFYAHLMRTRLLEETAEAIGGPGLDFLAGQLRDAEAVCEATGRRLPIRYLRDRNGLCGIEEDVLLLAVGMELDPSLAVLAARYYGNSGQGYASIALAQVSFAATTADRLRIAWLLRPGCLLLDCSLLAFRRPPGTRSGRFV